MPKITKIDRSVIIDFLLNPASYPHNPKSVKHIQTHASDVFIVSPYVYKIKKPVDFGFLDFSTIEKRKLYSHREVELNRRLSDGYIGVVKIMEENGGLGFDGRGSVVDYVVKMKEFSQHGFLKYLLHEGKVTEKHLRRIIEKLVLFYNGQQFDPEIAKYGSPEKISFNIAENFKLCKDFISSAISAEAYDAIGEYNELFFAHNTDLFNERMERGMIKDCHGDLHLEHIHIAPEAINIYDCIEFNDRFRYIDVASDIAFLAMDLDFNGRGDLSSFWLAEFAERYDDKRSCEIINVYLCYRAYVRGKVESLKSLEEEVPEKEKQISVAKAKRYFRLSLKYALFGNRPVCLVIFGIIGSGKSNFTNRLTKELDCEVFSSDYIRKELAGLKPLERKFEDFAKGLYSKEMTDRTYAEMIDRAKAALQEGKIPILDASFSKREYRELVSRELKSIGAAVIFIEVSASDETIKARLRKREAKGTSVSDARPDIFDSFKEGFEKPEEIPTKRLFTVRTDLEKDTRVQTFFSEVIKSLFN